MSYPVLTYRRNPNNTYTNRCQKWRRARLFVFLGKTAATFFLLRLAALFLYDSYHDFVFRRRHPPCTLKGILMAPLRWTRRRRTRTRARARQTFLLMFWQAVLDLSKNGSVVLDINKSALFHAFAIFSCSRKFITRTV